MWGVILLLFLTGCGKWSAGDKNVAVAVRVGIGKDNNEVKFQELGVVSPNANIYEPLVLLDENYQIKPLLATRWEYRGNNTWRFHLRQGVKFHNGVEFTSNAVKYTLEKAIRPSGRAILKIGQGAIRIVDRYTVDIVTSEPNMRVPEILAHPLNGMRVEGVEQGKTPVGTGPFRFVSYQRDKELVVEVNEDYWGNKPRVGKIIFKYIPDPNSRLLALQAGEVDVVKELPPEMLVQANSLPGVQLLAATQGPYVALSLLVNGQPPHDLLKDKNLRQALAYALDRQAIIDRVWRGQADPNQTMIPASILGEERKLVKGFHYDPAYASKLLEQAGWLPSQDNIRQKNGRKLELVLISGFPSAAALKPLPEVIQQQLRQVGVAVKIIEVADDGLYYEQLQQGKGDLWLERGNQNNGDPTFLPELLFHSRGYQSITYNKPFWPGESFDQLVERARQTPDIKEAAALMARAMHVLIDQETTVIPIAALKNVYAAREGIKGLMPHPADVNTRWENIQH